MAKSSAIRKPKPSRVSEFEDEPTPVTARVRRISTATEADLLMLDAYVKSLSVRVAELERRVAILESKEQLVSEIQEVDR